ncbi:MFS transporter [Klebsiella quasipneumoniae]|uniref:MFS transporter n=1 Tax=Klebsiella quasipneumoniae TaxID=1463165 RepID=UPI0018891DDE|nr:MFS transporter [Klebsiella quasipneumoniae]MDP1294164.1 MFS transporter [Klebsiella quasipneumoniae]HDU5303987.1 MFS transporter [Klebsiella quasipneumoniae subsp. similipneumoniae]
MSRTTTVDTVPADEVSVAGASRPDQFIKRGTPQFMRVTLALFSAGLATFALLYCVQPILPVLSNEFGVSPASSSISLSISTAMLAVGLLFTGPLSDAIGRKPVMVTALLLAACCSLLSTMMTSWHGILIMRALIGLSLSGVAAVGMTYLSEEIHPSFVAFSMGLYISGNSIGGMSGRLLTGVFTDFFGWRVALAVISGFALAAAIMFWRILPESRHFRPISLRPKTLLINFRLHWRDRGLPLLFIEGFLLMGAFVTLFNYIGYRLMMSPWSLSQAVVGLLSVAYLTGTWSSPKAGAMTVRYGRGPVMLGFTGVMLCGLLMTLFSSLWLIFIGMLLFSAGFFAAHSVASSWIGPRARRARGQASSLYLFSYYLGSSLAGTLGGVFWHRYGWNGVGGFIALLLLAALVTGTCLYRRLK